jgi:hypothetical protein
MIEKKLIQYKAWNSKSDRFREKIARIWNDLFYSASTKESNVLVHGFRSMELVAFSDSIQEHFGIG